VALGVLVEDDVVAPEFEVIEAGTVAQRVVGEVEDVVRLVVGKWNLSM